MRRLLNLLRGRRRRLEQDLDRELRYHFDRLVVDLMRSGASEAEARRRAALELGGIPQVQEEVRDTWIWGWLDQLRRDLRYGLRTLRRHPGFTATALLSLALGIGGSAAIFSLVDQVLLRPLPVREPSRLVLLDFRGRSLSANWGSTNLLSYPLCRDLEQHERFFEGVFCRYPTSVHLSTGGPHEPVGAELVSGAYFPTLGVRPALGRLLDPSDDRQPDAHPVVVLSHAYWQKAFGGARDVVGRQVLINNYPMTVVGVAPSGFRGVDPFASPSVWIPTMMKRRATPEFDRLLDRRAFWVHAFARLKPGVTAAQVEAGLPPWFASTLEQETRAEGFPSTTAEQRRDFLASTLAVLPATQGRSDLRPVLTRPLGVLMGGVLLLLVLATLNVAGLLLARGAARGRELTTRMALGASRERITEQLLVESLLIVLGGGLLGLLAAPAVARALTAFLSQDANLSFRIDGQVFLFAVLVAGFAAAVCGMAPLILARRIPLGASLRDGTRVAGGVRLRKALVVGQVAFTLVLLIGAGLFVQTLWRLYAKGPGFETRPLVMFRVDPTAIGYGEADAERAMRSLLQQVQALPGVERAAAANTHMLSGGSSSTVMVVPGEDRVVTDRVLTMRVGPGFFATLGAQLLAGRDFEDRDLRDRAGQETRYRSVIVNESFARRYLAGRNPIGVRIGLGSRPNTIADTEIIGVVRDFNRRSLRDDAEQAFFPFWDRDAGDGTFYLRVRGSPASILPAIRAAVRRVDPSLPVLHLRTLDEQIDQSLATERMLAVLSAGFGLIALLLSVVGLYGVMSFVVTQRTQEMGVRVALGATRGGVIWLVLRDALVMLGSGTVLAVPGIWALSRLVEAQLFGVRGADAPTVAAAAGVLALVALAAAMLPAWRAATVSPTVALRFE